MSNDTNGMISQQYSMSYDTVAHIMSIYYNKIDKSSLIDLYCIYINIDMKQ